MSCTSPGKEISENKGKKIALFSDGWECSMHYLNVADQLRANAQVNGPLTAAQFDIFYL